ncbi:MAG TPA: TIGR04282 family arsenosugar biosynthesis glycosyltransferase [Thermodesulfobacteriota bacterium]
MLLIFVKYPEPKKVKTRLAKNIGFENAAMFYRKMAEQIIYDLSKLADHRKIVFFDPPERKNDVMRWLKFNGLSFIAQEGNSLGEKMSNAFSHAFSLGADKTVIIGTDCPQITIQTILTAFEKLETSEVVIGPSYDGGYYLLGLRRFIPEIFHDIDWSTNLVFDQTIKKLRHSGIKSDCLEMLRDVDTIYDISNDQLLKIRKRI